MEIKVKRLNTAAVLPTKGSADAACCDLHANLVDKDSIIIYPHETVMIGTGLAMEIPTGFFGAVYARSGIASKRSLRPANCVGVIDSDYRGEIKVALHNDSEKIQYIHDGERIAQMAISPCPPVEYVEVDELDATERGAGGFGSTGTAKFVTEEPEYEQLCMFTD